jgi:hypothetical protein
MPTKVPATPVGVGVARFPFPPHGRIPPNSAGAEMAAARLLDIEPWKSATAIKVNPDSPQRPLRAQALRRGALGTERGNRLRSNAGYPVRKSRYLHQNRKLEKIELFRSQISDAE